MTEEARKRRTPAELALDELNRANRLADAAVVKRDNLRAQLRVTEETLLAAIRRRDYAAANPDLPDVLEKHTGASTGLTVRVVHGEPLVVEAQPDEPTPDAAESVGDDAPSENELRVDPWDEPDGPRATEPAATS